MPQTRWNRFRHAARMAACATTVFLAGNAHAQYGGPILSPPALSFPATPIGQQSAPQTVTVTAAASQTVVNLNSVVLPTGFQRSGGSCPSPSGAGSSPCTLDIVFAPTGAGAQGGPLAVTASTFGVPETSNISLSGTGGTSLDLSLSISDTPDPVIEGNAVTYALTVTKAAGTLPAGAVQVVVDSSIALLMPPTATGTAWACAASGVAQVTCTHNAAAAGATLPVLQLTYGTDTGFSSASITASEQYAAGAAFGDPSGPSMLTEFTGFTQVADLSFSPGSVTITPGSVAIGEVATINAQPVSNGPSSPQLFDVTIGLPPEVEPVLPLPGSVYNCVFAAPEIKCTFNAFRPVERGGGYPALPAIQVRAISFSATPVNLPVRISSTIASDPTPANDTVVLPLGIVGPDLVPAFDDDRDPVLPGAPLLIVGTLDNQGSAVSSATNAVRFSTTPNATFLNASGANWSCTAVAAEVQCVHSQAISAGGTSSLLFLNFTAPSSPGMLQTTVTSQAADTNPGNNTQSFQTTLAANDFAITGSGAPTFGVVPFESGLSLQPSYTGGGVSFSTQFTITAPLPTGVAVLSVDSQSPWSCPSPTTANPLVCTLGSIKRGDDPGPVSLPALGMVLVKSTPGQSTVPFVISADTGVSDPNVGNNTFNYILDGLLPAPDLALSMQPTVPSAPAGEVFGYQLTVENVFITPQSPTGNGVPATNVQIVDTLPAGTSFVGFSQSGSGGTWTCGPASTTVSCNLSGSLAPNATAPVLTLNLRYTDSTLPPGGGVTNTATVSGMPSGDPNAYNDTATATTGITAASDLGLALSDSADPVAPGDAFSYTIVGRNAGPFAASSANLALAFDLGLVEFVGTTAGSGWSCNSTPAAVAPNLGCSYAGSAVASGQNFPSVVLNLRARAISGQATHTLNAKISSTAFDPQPANNDVSEATAIRDRASLRLGKRASRTSAGVGDVVDFTLTATNGGSSAANGLVLLDNLPASLEFISASGEGWNCTQSNNIVDCRRQQLAAGGNSDVVISTRPRSIGTIVNSANLRSADAPTPVTANATIEVLNVGTVDVVLNKSVAGSGEVVPGGGVTYLFSIVNRGSLQAAEVVLDDPLPDGLTVNLIDAPAGVSCSGTDSLRCTVLNPVQPNSQILIRATVRVERAIAQGCTSIANTATVSTTSTEADQANNTSTASIQLCAPGFTTRYNMQLNISPRTLDYANQAPTLTLRNAGPGTYPGGPINFDFGTTGLRLESFRGCTSSGQTATCNLQPMPANFSLNPVDFRLVTTAATSPGGTIRVFVVPVAPGDTDEPDNEVILTVRPTAQPTGADLRLTGRALAPDVVVGSTANYEFIATNLGPAQAIGTVVTLTLPTGATLGNATNSFGTCATSGTEVRCTANGPLAVNAAMTINLGLRAPEQPGALVVGATVSSTSSDPGQGNNSATATSAVRLRNEGEIGTLLSQCAALDRIAQIPVAALGQACANPTPDMAPLCRALQNAAASNSCEEVRAALTEIAPKEVLAQSLLLKDFAQTQFFNVDARLSELRSGGGGFSASGLTLSLGGQAVSLGMLRDLKRALEGEDAEAEPVYDTDLVSPWGFFINGTISSGDQDLNTNAYKVKADFESRGLTAGVDYRFSPRLVAGAAFGYARFDADVSERSSLDTDARSLTVYGSWYPAERWYLDGRVSLGRASFELDRRIVFSIGGQSFDTTAVGSTDADQLTFALASGYHIQQGAWTITPNASFRHIKSDVDAFTETGANQFNVAYGDQSVTSSQFALGVQVNRPISLSNGVLSPQFDLSLNREIDNDDLVLEARMVGASAAQVFELRDDQQDSTYGTAGLGFVYVTANGKQAYLSYRRVFGQEGLDRGTLNLGARFEF